MNKSFALSLVLFAVSIASILSGCTKDRYITFNNTFADANAVVEVVGENTPVTKLKPGETARYKVPAERGLLLLASVYDVSTGQYRGYSEVPYYAFEQELYPTNIYKFGEMNMTWNIGERNFEPAHSAAFAEKSNPSTTKGNVEVGEK